MPHRLRGLLTLFALVAGLALPQGAYADDPVTISPERAGAEALRAGDVVTVRGAAAGERLLAAALLAFEVDGDVKRQEVQSRDLNRTTSGNYARIVDGHIDARIILGCLFGDPRVSGDSCPHDEVRDVGFEATVERADGTTYVVRAVNRLRVDHVPPLVAFYELIAPDRILVRFSEAVTHPSGDSVRDWEVEEDLVLVTAVSGPTENDCLPRGSGDDPRSPATGCTRTLKLSSSQERDATPLVDYFPPPDRTRYEDQARNQVYITTEGRARSLAADRVPPPAPRISSVNGTAVSGSGQQVRGPSSGFTVAVTEIAEGNTAVVYAGSDEIGRSTAGSSGAEVPVTVTLPDGSHVLTARALDTAECDPNVQDSPTCPNASGPSNDVTYLVDSRGPVAVPPAVGDGRFVTVRFNEPILGTNRAEDWHVTSGGPVESVSGSGDTRVVRTAATAAGKITWTRPAAGGSVDPYHDDSGNPLASFTLDILSPGDLLVGDVSATEGSPLGFTVTVARPSGDTTTYAVDFATEDGTATAGEDYTAKSGRLTFSGSETSKTVSVPTTQDDRAENAETVLLRLSNPTGGATLPNPSHATGTILEPGATDGLSIFDTRAHEGATARAVVQLAEAATEDVTVRWRTVDGTAKAGSDYTAGSGTLRIPAGNREGTIVVPLTADDTDEATESFSIELSEPVNATLQRDTATVSILDGAGVAPGIGRIEGPSRVETSAAVSKAFYASAGTVVVATANAYPDALAGAPLAEKHAAPILLTTRERLHPAITQEVERLRATTAYVLGGPNALSAQVDRDLRAAGVTAVHRLAGSNRFDTARIIAAEVGGDQVYVVEGNNRDPKRGWPDAVAVSALAAAQQRPILLVERDRLPGETAAALDRLDPSRATIVGGPAAVNDSVERAVDARAGTVDRVAGRTRYETSRAVASRAVAAGYDPGNTFFATGDDWPDSLSASPAVARTGGILLLVDSDQLDHSPPAREWLVTHKDRLRSITLIGGTKAITAFVAEQIRSQSGLQPR